MPKNSVSTTVLGESIFPAEQGDILIWESVNATEDWYIEVDYVRFTVDAIYNLTLNLENYLFLNYSLDMYHRFAWVPLYENAFYMAYNKTLNFLNWSESALEEGFFFIFPTPVNLTLIQETIEAGMHFNTSIDGEKLVLDYGNNTIIEHTIDSTGISKVIEKITNGTTVFKWEYNEEDVIVRIPFGLSVLLYTGIGIIFLVLINIVKLKKCEKIRNLLIM
ncbi:MAG: hypothetical protein ACFFKA_18055 [Candidatus Thorarchaeota archaeon]